MSLPRPEPFTPADLARFERRHGLPVLWAILRREFGHWVAARILLGVVARGAFRDPFRAAGLPPARAADDVLSRRQLRAVLLLDDVLQARGLEDSRRVSVLSEVVAQTGVRFLDWAIPFVDEERWRPASAEDRLGYARAVLGRFFNSEASRPQVSDTSLAFDVTRCRFVDLTASVGRPELARMFCAADSVRFGAADSPLRLEREGTLAEGAACCDFRFTLRPQQEIEV